MDKDQDLPLATSLVEEMKIISITALSILQHIVLHATTTKMSVLNVKV